ncbi:invasion associated locus B family protein [Paracoccus sp. NSM]|uniref:invasion associated locus B family protein n=1 Tax=Paracoccus sp. NSM TaxID=3457784 RepID=UPI0040358364
MQKTTTALLAALALAAMPAFAQDAPATDTPAETAAETATETTTETPAETTAEATASEQAAEADGAPRPGTYYALSEHQDWVIRCIRTEQPKDPCEMYKLLVDGEDNAVAELSVFPLLNGELAAGARLIAPLETDLLNGLGLQIDNGEARGYPFGVCTQVGCVSQMGFTAEEVAAMKRGTRATIQLLPFGGDPAQPVSLAASLSGFTAAFDALSAYVEAEPEAPAAEDAGTEAEEPADAPEEAPAE